jgi:hypothetical protein
MRFHGIVHPDPGEGNTDRLADLQRDDIKGLAPKFRFKPVLLNHEGPDRGRITNSYVDPNGDWRVDGFILNEELKGILRKKQAMAISYAADLFGNGPTRETSTQIEGFKPKELSFVPRGEIRGAEVLVITDPDGPGAFAYTNQSILSNNPPTFAMANAATPSNDTHFRAPAANPIPPLAQAPAAAPAPAAAAPPTPAPETPAEHLARLQQMAIAAGQPSVDVALQNLEMTLKRQIEAAAATRQQDIDRAIQPLTDPIAAAFFEQELREANIPLPGDPYDYIAEMAGQDKSRPLTEGFTVMCKRGAGYKAINAQLQANIEQLKAENGRQAALLAEKANTLQASELSMPTHHAERMRAAAAQARQAAPFQAPAPAIPQMQPQPIATVANAASTPAPQAQAPQGTGMTPYMGRQHVSTFKKSRITGAEAARLMY